ncbi:hypothetical protein D9619_009763 [Psilocybe cf. subviscida]|uniref:Uncharacterized protein n=1 Tax=Psilocybe cf. subviscida TaxID=2480587 RepID=A0A8H5F6C2_9AGAR|nr:hypothetical protein D9619_009763 [Psilocybe cf. subviscida]
MGSICFSAATILRCTYLTPLQTIALVIPTVLEVLCSSSLIFKHKSIGRKHLLLTAEGWVYLLLSVSQMISEIVPAVRDNLNVRRAFDTGIGVASFLPLFFYTFFFFVFTSSELLETLPKQFINIAKYSIVLFIPAIVVFNEIASFTGVVIRSLPLPDAPQGSRDVTQFFFLDKRSDLLWSFFTSLTLALLTAFQAAVFSFAFFRLVRAILNQRRIENNDLDKAHLFNGIVWLCAGVKIGALESLVGLFGGGFGLALTRRIMRMMSRGCIAVGIAKGVDVMEDFRMIQRELRKSNENRRGQRRSRLREFISNPRLSTFRTLSPTATSFHASTRVVQPPVMEKEESTIGQRPHYITFSQRQSYLSNKGGLPGMKDFAVVREERLNRRVTVLHTGEDAPKLQMRFSALEVPAPVLLASDIKGRPQSEVLDRPITTNLSINMVIEDSPYDEKSDPLELPQPHFHRGTIDSQRRDSNNSSLGSPYEIVDAHKLTQTIAVGQLYRPQAMRTPSTAALARETVTTPLSAQPTVNPPGLQRGVDDSRTKSLISTKTNSISAAVRDLADKFPGPPDVSKTRPVVDNKPAFLLRRPQVPVAPVAEEKSAWEEDSRASMAAGMSPQAIGSPSEISHGHAQTSHSGLLVEDDRAYVSGESSPLAFALPSPVRGGKALVTNPDYRISTTSRRSRKSEKATTATDDDYELSKTPVSAPLGVPLRKSLKLSVAATPVPIIRQNGNYSPATPTTGLSILSRIQESVAPNQADPFTELGTALDTGKSRNFRDEAPPVPLPSSASRFGRFKSEEKLNRVTEWLDRSASWAQEHIDPEAPPTMEELTARPPIIPSPREKSLQNLHERGKSIDALTIPWIKTPELAEARSKTGRATASYEATMRMVGPRIKTVGKAPSRSTPKPTRTAHARASLYLQPIIIPPPSGNMPQIEDASPMEFDNSNVLKDSEVLAIENSTRPRQPLGRL